MRMKEFARFLRAARKDASSRFREQVKLLNGTLVLCESKGEVELWSQFCDALRTKDLDVDQFSIREAFESLIEGGREIVDSWNPRHGGSGGINLALLEAAGTVDTSAFSNITGQIVYTTILQAYQSEDFIFTKLIPTVSTPFNGEKIPGIGELGDEAEIVGEGQQYPMVGLSEDWIETPPTLKRGLIVPFTKEIIFFERTGLALQRGKDIGKWMGVNREKRAIDCVIDENTTAHRYKWKGTSYATYQTSTPYDNVTATNALVDWTDMDNAEQTLNGILDPNTGEPVTVEAKHFIVTKQLEQTANRIVNATEIEVVTPGYATSGNPQVTKVGNPYKSKYQVVTSKLLAARLATDTDWFLGNITEAFRYMENFPLAVVQAPSNSNDEFHRDIVTQYKASERGQFATFDPRFMSKSTVA